MISFTKLHHLLPRYASNSYTPKTYALPVGAHLMFEEGAEVKAGEIFVKTPRAAGSAGDITGGLHPRSPPQPFKPLWLWHCYPPLSRFPPATGSY